jgi:hypothetical protein
VPFLAWQADQIATLRSIISSWFRLAIFDTMTGEGDQRLGFIRQPPHFRVEREPPSVASANSGAISRPWGQRSDTAETPAFRVTA